MVLLRVPASWLTQAVNAHTDGVLRLTDSSGTLWEGRADLWLRVGENERWVPWQPVQWHVDFGGLWQGQLRLRTNLGGLVAGRQGIYLEQLRADVPASALIGLGPSALSRLAWRGDVAVEIDHWRCAWNGLSDCVGKGHARWAHVSTPLFRTAPFDEAELFIQGKGNSSTLTLTTQGMFTVTSEGHWRPTDFTLAGHVRGPSDALDGLQKVAGDILLPGDDAGHRKFLFRRP